MKKSKLVQNSRDLLSRSFNPSKCKTSLRLAGSRVKLLRNKKEVQVKQMKREIAQLLESGQDQTARIRVEHVIREEKMMAAYDLLEIYCELVIARLPIIESQKNCPIDLKEAIASLVFAAPRCGDIPELLDVRKQITAKYGKEFTTAAVELRPQCGVDRMLVEKLSATAPNLETKTKILTTIAEEHNVKWEPKSFGEKDPGSFDDRLSGSLGKLSEQYPEPPPQDQVRPSNNMMSHLSPSDFVQQSDRTSEKLLFAQTSGSTTPYQYEARPLAPVDERSREDSNMHPPDRHMWYMEFKDATSAAQAAAESAERASMAARAAAELSSHNQISRQYSTEMHNSNVASLKYEGPPKSKSSNASNDRSSTEHGTRLQNVKQADECKPNNQKTTTSFEEDSTGSSQGHIPSFSSNPKDSIEEYSKKNSLNEVPNDEMEVEKQSFSYEAETGNSSPEEAENIEEKRTLRRHSIKSFRSQSSILDDNVNIFSNSEYKKLEKDAGKSPVVDGQAPQMSTQESAALFFDKYDSDTDDGGFDVGPTYDEREESEIHLPFFGRKSPEKAPAVEDSWSPPTDSPNKIPPSTLPFFIIDGKSSDFSENTKSRNDSELNSAHVTFDESDGPFSDSDDDTKNPRRHTGYDSTDVHKRNERGQSVKSSFKHEYSSLFSDKDLQLSSDDELSPSLKVRCNNSNWDHMSVEDSPRKLSFIKPDANQPALELKEFLTEPTEIDTESNSESEQRLNFGKLTGGFRHKSHHNQLSFIKSRLNVPSDKESETIYRRFEEPEIGTTSHHKEISMMQDFHLASDTDNCEEELSRSSRGKLESKEVKTKPNFFISSDNSDAGDYSPKDHVRSGFSRRTKASPSIPKKDSYSEEVLDSDARIAKTPTTSSNSGTPKISESTLKNSSKLETYEHPKPMPARSNFWGPPPLAKASFVTKEEFEARDTDSSPGRKSENSYSLESQKAYEPQKKSSLFGNSGQATPVKLASKPTNSSSTSMQGSNVSQKSSVVEDPPGYKLKDQAPVGSNNVSSSNKDVSPKKAAHVHPKLPDYDTLFQTLRMNRS